MSDAGEPDPPQQPQPSDAAPKDSSMEIHKPHAAKTWKEFFIELGTIVIGILIAIALEQTVDHFRHVNQLRTVRGELAAEVERNQEIAARNAASFTKIRAALARNTAILRSNQANHGQIAAQ